MRNFFSVAERILAIILTIIMLKAGAAKAKDIYGMYVVVGNYNVLPRVLAAPATALIITVELVTAALLILGGPFTLLGGVIGSVMQFLFIAVSLVRLNTVQPHHCGYADC
ncbi:MAG: MauE/DoxX family redox-associated membrane protein [Bacillota bacterium]